MVKLVIDVGRNKRVNPADVVGAIANEGNIPGKAIGNIDIRDRFTLVDVPAEFVEQIVKQMSQSRIRGQNANIRVAGGKDFASNESSRDRIFKDKKGRKKSKR